MNYQNLLCVGDSQTFGARTYGCYPLFLAQMLSEQTPYQWRTINRSVNGYTARDLWFLLNLDVERISDTFQACVLIGVNDVGRSTDPDIFEEYYRQILRALFIKSYKAVLCGEIPPIYPDGHIFFGRESERIRTAFNERIEKIVAEFPMSRIIRFAEHSRDCYEDPVHFNELGNRRTAAAFCEGILSL